MLHGGAQRRVHPWRCTLLLLLTLAQLVAAAPAGADIRYIYDALGRLVRVIREDGEAATYYYDAVGNLLRITRESGVSQSLVVTSASPSTGRRGSTAALTITGDNLAGSTLSSANPGIAISEVRPTITQVTATLAISPTATLGPTTLTVRSSLGSASLAFTVAVGPPTITSVAPLLGPVGTSVTIQGTQFDDQTPANNQVTFSGAAATVQSATITTLVVTVPTGATSGPVTVTTAGGSATSAATFITGQIFVSSVAPETAQRGTTLAITIAGSNLLNTSISRPGMTVNTLTATATQISAGITLSTSAIQSEFITVTNQVTSATIPFPALPLAPPTITAFGPPQATQGAPVTIDGTNFDERGPAFNQVSFNGVPTTVQSVTERQLTALVPAGATSGPISVTTATGTATGAAAFITGQVVATSVSPTEVTRGTTATLTIVGSNLLGSSIARPGLTATSLTVSETQITAGVSVDPDAPQPGSLTVSNILTTATLPLAVRIGPPAITGLSASGGQVTDPVSITGVGFDEVTAANNVVRFNGTMAEIVAVTPTRIDTRVPAGATTGRITVTTPAGTATSATDFTIGGGGLTLTVAIQPPFGFITDLVVRSDGARAYVFDGASVRAVDTSTHTVIGTVPFVGVSPNRGALSPDNSRLYAFNADATLQVVDVVANQLIATIPVPDTGNQLVITPNGATVIASHGFPSGISLIDTVTNTVAATIPLTGSVIGVRVSPDGSRAYVAASDGVAVVDTVARTLITTIPLSGAVGPGAIHPDGTRYYQTVAGTVVVIDTATNAVLTTIPDTGMGDVIAIHPTGVPLYVAVEGNPSLGGDGLGLVIIDTVSNTVATVIPTTGIPTALALTRDGQRVVVGSTPLFGVGLREDVTIVDGTSNALLATFPLNGLAAGHTGSISNSLVYVGTGPGNNGAVAVVNATALGLIDAPISRVGVGTDLLAAPNGAVYATGGVFDEMVTAFDSASLTARPNLTVPRDLDDLHIGIDAVAVDPGSSGTLYVATQPFVHFVNPTTGALLGTLTIRVVTRMLPSPDGTRLYVISSDGTVRVVDPATRTMLGSLALGSSVGDAVLTGAGTKLYVLGSGGQAVHVIDPAGPTLLRSIPVGTFPFTLALANNDQRLVVVDPIDNTITLIDTTTDTVAATLTPGGSLFHVAAVAGLGRAFVTDPAGNQVMIVDTVTNTLAGSIALTSAPSAVTLSPDGSRLYVVQSDTAQISVIDPQTGAILTTLTSPIGGPLGRAVVAPNGRVFVPVGTDFSPTAILVLQ